MMALQRWKDNRWQVKKLVILGLQDLKEANRGFLVTVIFL